MMSQSTVMTEPTTCAMAVTKGKTIHHTTEHSCREAPNQAAVSVAMMLVSGGRNIPGG
jgi:hypothetical protein